MEMTYDWVKCYKPDGKIDKAEEIDRHLKRGYSVLKAHESRGGVVYCAIKLWCYPEVFGIVALTDVDKDGNLGLLFYNEDENPEYADCPASILKRLSPTKDKDANEWRSRCWQNVEKRKRKVR